MDIEIRLPNDRPERARRQFAMHRAITVSRPRIDSSDF